MKQPCEQALIQAGLLAAQRITRRWAKTFYAASLLLPRQKRTDSYALYALCRLSDESVDTSSDKPTQLKRLEAITRQIGLAYSETDCAQPLLCAFKSCVRRNAIPKEYFDELITGMRMDLEKNRYDTFNQLYGYCYKVAGVVGLLMLQVLGFKDAQAKAHAVELGIAMQLTNILRDIREDYGRGRIYLPRDEMDRFGIKESDLAAQSPHASMREFMQFQIHRARSYYTRSLPGIRYLATRNARLVTLAMAHMYAGILDRIQTQNASGAPGKRAHLSGAQKTACLLKILMKGEYL